MSLAMEEQLDHYRDLIESSKKLREEQRPDWIEALELYSNEHHFGVGGGHPSGRIKDRYSANMVFATVFSNSATTLIRKPFFRVKAKVSRYRREAIVRETVANCLWKFNEFSKPVSKAALDSELRGLGCVKIGWNLQTREMTKDEKEDAVREYMEKVATAAPGFGNPSLTRSEKQRLYSEVAIADEPFLEYIPIDRMLLDPLATCLDNMRFVCEERYVTQAWVDENEYWPDHLKECLGSVDVQGREGLTETQRRSPEDLVKFYELYNYETNTFCQFADSGDDFLIEPTEAPLPFGSPYVFLPNIVLVDEVYPRSIIRWVKNIQYAFDRARTEQLRTLEDQVTQFHIHEGFARAAPDAVEAIVNRYDNVAVTIPDPFWDQEVVRLGPSLQQRINPDLYAMASQHQQDFQFVSGVDGAFLGAATNPYESATSVAAGNYGRELRAQARGDQIADFLVAIIDRCLDASAQLLKTDMEFPIGDEGRRYVEALGDDIAGYTDDEGVDQIRRGHVPDYVKFSAEDLGPYAGYNRFFTSVENRRLASSAEDQARVTRLVNGLVPLLNLAVQTGASVDFVAVVVDFLDAFDIPNPERYLTALDPIFKDPNAPPPEQPEPVGVSGVASLPGDGGPNQPPPGGGGNGGQAPQDAANAAIEQQVGPGSLG